MVGGRFFSRCIYIRLSKKKPYVEIMLEDFCFNSSISDGLDKLENMVLKIRADKEPYGFSLIDTRTLS